MRPKVVSLFTGAGGFDLGFEKAGFDIICASDIWKESKDTMAINFPGVPFIHDDIRKIHVEDILDRTQNVYPDVIIGGPPCQGFSVMGDKNSSDPRNTLYESYVRLVEGLNPSAFVFENVKGIKTMFQGRYLELVVNGFSRIGYDVHLKVLNSAKYGVAQNRERVILIGTNRTNGFTFPVEDTSQVSPLVGGKCVRDVIWDLISLGEEIPNHISLDHGWKVIERYKLIKEGGKLPPPEELPEEIRRKNFGNTYVRLHRDKPSPTMVPGNNAFPIHPVLNRSLTPREAARIQSFPDEYIFSGPRREQCILIGNAVPPLMAFKIAKEIKSMISDVNYSGSNEHLIAERKQVVELSKNVQKMKVVDLFSGAGGISLGFHQAGFEHVFSADFDKDASETHRLNFPDVPFIEGDLSKDEVKKQIYTLCEGQKIDVLAGGPPCQGFSMFGKRRFIQTKGHKPENDIRNNLPFTFIEIASKLEPTWIFMENVPGIVNLNEGYYLEKIISELNKIGYNKVEYRIISTADYGAPQTRKRFILMANKHNLIIPWPKAKYYKTPEDWQKPYRSVIEVISDLQSAKSYSESKNHVPMKHSAEVIERFSYIRPGAKLNPSDLPSHLKISKQGNEIKSFSKVLFRLDPNGPSPTLVPGHSAFPIHPTLDRQITIREAARIQTFPDTFRFTGGQGRQCKQVGNAFPPLVAETFANAIVKSTNNNWTEEGLSKHATNSIIR